jgi:hypothetical protein
VVDQFVAPPIDAAESLIGGDARGEVGHQVLGDPDNAATSIPPSQQHIAHDVIGRRSRSHRQELASDRRWTGFLNRHGLRIRNRVRLAKVESAGHDVGYALRELR